MALGSLNRTKSAGDLISEVGVEVGLNRVSDPFISNDPKYIQLIVILNLCGNELIDLYRWTRFQRRHALTTQDGVTNYNLPSDWNAMIDQTAWSSSSATPATPISPQEWQYVTNNSQVPVIEVLIRERNGYLSVPTGTPAGIAINLEYESRGWVYRASTPNDLYDNATSSSDVVLHDPTLFSRYLKMKFLEAIGFDTQKATDEFNLLLDIRTSKDKTAPILNLGKGASYRKYIDDANIPETGFGS